MKRNTVLVAIGVLILSVAVGIYYCKTTDDIPAGRFCEGPPPPDGPPGEYHPGREKILLMLRRELRLTDKQYDKILQLHEQNDIALTKNRYRVHRMMDVLKKELLNSTFNEKKIRKILEDIDTLKREDRIKFIKLRFDMKKILTREQAAAFDRILDERFRSFHRRHRFGNRPMHHNHPGRGRDD